MIHEYLGTGAANARPGKELADLLSCDIREITAAVERERRDGQPICASSDSTRPGYYLAADREELLNYCNVMHKRASQMHKTRRMLLKIAGQLPERAFNPPGG